MKRNTLLFAFGLIAASLVGFQTGRLSPVDSTTTPTTTPSTATGQASIPTQKVHPSKPGSSEPIIGIASLASDAYVRAIRECGGTPVILPNTDGSPEKVDEYLELLDGLLMPGGADIPPSEWGAEPHPTTNLLEEDRYLFEKAMITAWIQKTDKPLLGICLGSQWVNVAHGGSLVQDIPSEFGGHPRGENHMVILDPKSRLSEIFGETEFEVNSLHHQSARQVGEGLRAVAKSPDGIIEATESIDPSRFLIGVQWHPEKLMPESQLQAKLIQAFVDAAAKRAQRSHSVSPMLSSNDESAP